MLAPAPTTDGAETVEDLVRPGVAESFEVSDDGETYTFNLRDDARWSNGDPVTADDFVFAWKRVLTPDFSANYAPLFFVIEGARDYKEGKTDQWDAVGIHAEDSRTLVVNLAERTPWFPELVSFFPFFPVPRDVVEEDGDDWAHPNTMVTNGAYSLSDYKARRHLALEANPHYWDRSNVGIDRVVLRIFSDRRETVHAFKSGEVDWVDNVRPNAVDEVDAYSYPLLGTYYFNVNMRDRAGAAPLRDARVRRALSLALDREELLADATDTAFEPAHSMVPPYLLGYEPPSDVRYDPDKARRLLAEAGFDPEKKSLRLTLLYNTDPMHKRIAERAQAMWRDELGVRVELEDEEWVQYLERLEQGDFQIARQGWIGDYHSPRTFLDLWSTENRDNNSGWSNRRYDALVEEARRTADPDERAARYREAEEILLEEAVAIPVYHYSLYGLISGDFEGVEPHTRGIHLIKYISPR
ncbi:MAG: peptide ABC transporter substrate-binding protein [Persicimonas sp.]